MVPAVWRCLFEQLVGAKQPAPKCLLESCGKGDERTAGSAPTYTSIQKVCIWGAETVTILHTKCRCITTVCALVRNVLEIHLDSFDEQYCCMGSLLGICRWERWGQVCVRDRLCPRKGEKLKLKNWLNSSLLLTSNWVNWLWCLAL